MNLNYIIKAFPFLSTFLLIIFLNLANQKESAKLKILIWNTPTLSLGSYLALSSGTGFILSYLFTTNLANINRLNTKNLIEYKSNEIKKPTIEYQAYEDNNPTIEYKERFIGDNYEKTLIERDMNDSSPTLNASFRVISKTERVNTNVYDYDNNQSDYSDIPNYVDDDLYAEQKIKSKNNSSDIPEFLDWNDESFLNW